MVFFLAERTGVCSIPSGVSFSHILGAGMLGGIGFTMSIFITNLAFVMPNEINAAKMAILVASLVSGLCGWIWLRRLK